MALDTYANFQAAIADHLVRTDMTSQIVDCITLFEAEAASELFRAQAQETQVILHPNETELINVTGAADNGSGLIRLTVDDTTGMTGPVNVADVGGTTEANGQWSITVINGTTLDLTGSAFVNTYTSGGTVQDEQGFVALPSDYIAWRRVTSLSNPRMDLTFIHPSLFIADVNEFFTPSIVPLTRTFTIEGRFLFATPGAAIEMLYYARNPAVASSIGWLFSYHVDAYWNGVLEQVYTYTRDYDKATYYQQKKAAIFDRIKKQRLREHGQLGIRIYGSNYGMTP